MEVVCPSSSKRHIFIKEAHFYSCSLQVTSRCASRGTRRSLSPEEQAVQTFGRTLFDALMEGDVGRHYAVCRARADQKDKGLRLRLHIHAPDLAALPWEYLFDQGTSEYLGLSRYTPIVRYLNLPRSRQALTIVPPLRILGMVASPNSPATPLLDVETEKARLNRALGGLTKRGLVEFHWLEGHTWRDLQQAMWSGPWHIFHFIGHGGFNEQTEEGLLALEDEAGGLHLLSANHLGRALKDHRSLRLVFLNACEGARAGKHDIFSSVGATLARAGIPAVLAMQYEITDRAALELTHTFYAALAANMPVDAALSEARNAIYAINNSLEWGTPVLFLRASNSSLFRITASTTQSKDARAAASEKVPPLAPLEPPLASQLASSIKKDSRLKQLSPQVMTELYDAVLRRRIVNLSIIRRIILCFEAVADDPLLSEQASFDAAAGAQNLLHHLYQLEVQRAAQSNQQKSPAALVTSEKTVNECLQEGAAHLNAKRYREALAAYDQAITIDLTSPAAYYGKGIVLGHLQQHVQAVDAFNQAILFEPTHMLAYYCKGIAFGHLGRYQESLAATDQAILLDPTNAEAYNNRGAALEKVGRKSEAQQAYRRARELGYKA